MEFYTQRPCLTRQLVVQVKSKIYRPYSRKEQATKIENQNFKLAIERNEFISFVLSEASYNVVQLQATIGYPCDFRWFPQRSS